MPKIHMKSIKQELFKIHYNSDVWINITIAFNPVAL